MSQTNYSTGDKKYNHIQKSERIVIERMKREGASNAEIARLLYRSKSSIGRELLRNSVEQRETIHTNSKSADIPLHKTIHRYYADSAQRQYSERRLRTGARCKLAESSMFIQYLEEKVKGPEKWSVDATVGWAKRHGLFSVIPCTKTVYNWIDAGFCGIRNIDLLLKVKRKPKRPALKRKRILGRSIEERPISVNERQEFAHWEGDGVVGAGRKGHILTLVERTLGYGILWDAKDRCASRVVAFVDELQKQYGSIFPAVFKTITFDNGSEFSDSQGIEKGGRLMAYYAHPYSSYERGTDENWNGILRRFVPKGKSFEDLDADTLKRINRYINQLPRKRFNYRTPEELFQQRLEVIMNTADTLPV
jgi:IS30 family transposase